MTLERGIATLFLAICIDLRLRRFRYDAERAPTVLSSICRFCRIPCLRALSVHRGCHRTCRDSSPHDPKVIAGAVKVASITDVCWNSRIGQALGQHCADMVGLCSAADADRPHRGDDALRPLAVRLDPGRSQVSPDDSDCLGRHGSASGDLAQEILGIFLSTWHIRLSTMRMSPSKVSCRAAARPGS